MSYKKNPFDPYERIGTTGGLPGGANQGRSRIPMPVVYWTLGLAALFILTGLWWRSGDGEVQAGTKNEKAGDWELTLDAPRTGEASGKPSQPSSADKLAGTAKAPTESAAPKTHKGLTREVEIQVAEWMAKASKASKRKVTASNTVVSVHVRDMDGRVLVDRQTSLAVAPASNLKILTCASAVILAADEDRFVTRFEAVGEIEGSKLRGDLIVRAGGDPLYREGGDGSLDHWFDPLAKQLKAAGIQGVTGRVILDEGSYSLPMPAAEWPTENQHWKEFCALAGGFSANAGCMTATIRAGKVGKSAGVEIRPRGHGLKRRSSEKVSTVGKGNRLIIAVEARGTRLMVRGKLPADVPKYEARFAHPDPVDLFGHALLAGLQARGIQVKGGFERLRNAPVGKDVAFLESPLADTLVPILTESNNSVADQVFLWLGHRFGGEGTAIGGARAVTKALEKMGVDPSGLVLADGSGLSKANRVRADQLTAVLSGVYQRQDDLALAFRRALPVAGESGTLSRRMRSGSAKGNVMAKTGWVEGSSSLSGFVQTKSGRQLVFSILVHYPRVSSMNNNVFKPMQDAICEVLANFDGKGL